MPMVNMISGGLHAGGNLDFQDFLIIPVGAATYAEALEMTAAVYRAVGAVLRADGRGGRASSATRGATARGSGPTRRPSTCILEAVLACGLEPGRDVAIALDVAATHFYDPDTGTYHLAAAGDDALDSAGMIAMLAHWAKLYPIVSIEDGLAEDDWDGWAALTARLGGDGPAHRRRPVRHPGRRGSAQGIERKAANAVLIKLNQVGTLTETLDAILPGPPPRLPHDRLGPLGRDRGHDDRRPRRRHRRRPDQDRLGGPLRAAGQVQPPAPDRGPPRPPRPLRRPRGAWGCRRCHRRAPTSGPAPCPTAPRTPSSSRGTR